MSAEPGGSIGAIKSAVFLALMPAHAAPGSRGPGPVLRLLAAITATGLLLIILYGLRIVSTAALVAVPTALFLAVYLGEMATAARVLRGPVRLAALPAALAVTAMLGFCSWALAVPAAVALAVSWRAQAGSRRHARNARPGRRAPPGEPRAARAHAIVMTLPKRHTHRPRRPLPTRPRMLHSTLPAQVPTAPIRRSGASVSKRAITFSDPASASQSAHSR